MLNHINFFSYILERSLSQDQLQKELGPYLVNINIVGQESVISGSVNNLYQSPFVFHDVTAFGSNTLLNGASYGGCLNQVLGQRTNGFTVRRYIPHAPDPVLLNAYYLEQTLINSASTDAFLHRIELLERYNNVINCGLGSIWLPSAK